MPYNVESFGKATMVTMELRVGESFCSSAIRDVALSPGTVNHKNDRINHFGQFQARELPPTPLSALCRKELTDG